MDIEIKNTLQRFLNLCDDMNERIFADGNGSLKNEVKVDLLYFLLYLSYSDKNVSDKEIECINYYFDEEYKESDQLFSAESKDRELSVPVSLTYFIKIDNDNYTEQEMVSTLTAEMIGLYKKLGMEIICSDRALVMTEFKDYEDYISMMETYASAYLKSGYEKDVYEERSVFSHDL